MKLDLDQVLKTPKGQPLVDSEGKEMTLREAIYGLGNVAYQGQPPEDKAKLARIAIKLCNDQELKVEDVALLKKTAVQVYSGFAIVAIEDALEG